MLAHGATPSNVPASTIRAEVSRGSFSCLKEDNERLPPLVPVLILGSLDTDKLKKSLSVHSGGVPWCVVANEISVAYALWLVRCRLEVCDVRPSSFIRPSGHFVKWEKITRFLSALWIR